MSNSKGHSLIDHSYAVAYLSKGLAKYLKLDSDLVDCAFYNGLLHDIGKCVSYYQDYFKCLVNKIDTYSFNVKFPLHHEISWAYLSYKTHISSVLKPIYWHHSRPVWDKKLVWYTNRDNILNQVDEKDFQILEDVYSIFQNNLPNTWTPVNTGSLNVPDLFDTDTNSVFPKIISGNSLDNVHLFLLRMCLISADRYVSSLSTIPDFFKSQEVKRVIDVLISGGINKNLKICCPRSYNEDRFNYQYRQSILAQKQQTSLIKGPAGFGKTLVGILWALNTNKRLIWVCPRNAVAESIYQSISNELKSLKIKCGIELYLTGQRIHSNDLSSEIEFGSDIVVTNIDNVLGPLVQNKHAGRLFAFVGSHMVFDEFHEIISNNPLFAAFITLIKARHQISSNSKTLLLSATPTNVYCLWDCPDKTTKILPNNTSHFIRAYELKEPIERVSLTVSRYISYARMS